MSNKGKTNLLMVFMLISIYTALYISIKAALGHSFWIDDSIVRLASQVSPSLHPFFIKITAMGDKIVIGVVALITLIWLLLRRKNYIGAAVFALSLAIGNEINSLIKDIIERPRPSLEHLVPVSGYSFPSGHAMVGMIVYFFITFLLIEASKSRAVKIVAGVLAAVLLLLIGASRIILQVHYPSDVIGGFALGYIWVLISIYIYKLLQRKYGKG